MGFEQAKNFQENESGEIFPKLEHRHEISLVDLMPGDMLEILTEDGTGYRIRIPKNDPGEILIYYPEDHFDARRPVHDFDGLNLAQIGKPMNTYIKSIKDVAIVKDIQLTKGFDDSVIAASKQTPLLQRVMKNKKSFQEEIYKNPPINDSFPKEDFLTRSLREKRDKEKQQGR